MNTKKRICGIYKITSPKGRVYIGQSIDCYARKRTYKNGNANSQSRLENSIKKHGWMKHKFEVIHICESHELNKLEIYYIELFQSFGTADGLNLKAGGQNGGVCSEETKRKIAASRIGKKLSEEHRRKISLGGMGRTASLETRMKRSQSLLQAKIVRTDEWKEKQRIARHNSSYRHSEETKLKMSKAHKGKKQPEHVLQILATYRNGNKNMLGKKHSPQTIEKMRIAKLGKKRNVLTDVNFTKK